MLRSFDYAAWSAVMSLSELDAGSAEIVRSLAERWRRAVEAAFLATYREIIAGCPSYPEDEAEAARLLDLFLLEKALYEICYEAANRPNWLRIPLQGVMGLLEPEPRRDDQG
jgi:maltose alpha-D-glucosyltransferase/alpha-amylase